MSNKSHFFRQSSGGGFNPLQLNPVIYINASQGVNLDPSGFVDTVDDLSGNDYNFTGVNSPELETSGINGLPSIEFNGSNYLSNTDNITDRPNKEVLFIWLVFEITISETNSYHNIIINGANSYTSAGSNYLQLYNPRLTNDFIVNYVNNSLDDTINDTQLTPHYAIIDKTEAKSTFVLNGVSSVKNGSQVVNDNILIGSWFGRNAKMLLSEYGMLNYTPTAQQIQDLKDYFTNTYNL